MSSLSQQENLERWDKKNENWVYSEIHMPEAEMWVSIQ